MKLRRFVGVDVVAVVVLSAMKLSGVADWSWWWITAPLWAGALLGFLVWFWFVARMGLVAWRIRRIARNLSSITGVPFDA